MIRRHLRFRTKLFLFVASVLLLLVGYAWLCHKQKLSNPNDTTIPNIAQFQKGWEMMTDVNLNGEMWLRDDFKATYLRYFYGLAVGIFGSYIIGVLMGCFTEADAFLSKVLKWFSRIPPTGMMAVYFVIFGIETKMYMAVISFGIMPILVQSISESIRKDVGENEIFKARTLGADTLEVIWDVCVKQTFPRVLEAIRLQLAPALIFLIAAEMVVADIGVGYRLRIQCRLLHMNVAYIYLALMGMIGVVMDVFFEVARKKLCPWYSE